MLPWDQQEDISRTLPGELHLVAVMIRQARQELDGYDFDTEEAWCSLLNH